MHIRLILLLSSFILLSSLCITQTPDQKIESNTFNRVLLENTIKTKIDSVRKAHKCGELRKDSILYISATDHSKYLIKKGVLSHTQNGVPKKKTPQDRAMFYGAQNIAIGENIALNYFNIIVINKKGKKNIYSTYNQLAQAIVDEWINSPGHFKNIINCNYQVTGLAVCCDVPKQKVYIVQNFGIVY